MTKTADYYLGLPYRRRVRVEVDEKSEYFVAYMPDLPGVEASGSTNVEAFAELRHAFEEYLDAMIGWGEEIPEPAVWPEAYGWGPGAVSDERASVTVMEIVSVEVGSEPASSALQDRLEEFKEQVRAVESSTALVAV